MSDYPLLSAKRFYNSASLALMLACALFAGACGGDDEKPSDGDPENVNERDKIAKDDQGNPLDFDDQSARGYLMQIDPSDVPYDITSYDEFMKTRCVELGSALEAIATSDGYQAERAWNKIEEFKAHDDEVTRKAAPNPPSGLIIPRYIAAELMKSKAQRNLEWLGRQGVMLQANYEFESEDPKKWEEASTRLVLMGEEGQTFLAMQMVIRLQHPQLYGKAQELIVRDAAAQAAPFLVTACHMQLGSQPNVFAFRARDTLGMIGVLAVPSILQAYRRSDTGAYVPVSDENYRSRRCLSDALGRIGDASAVETLVRELDEMEIENESSRLLYTEVLVDALAKIGDIRGRDPIIRAWKRERDDSFFAKSARTALRKLTGKVYNTPEG